VARKYDPLKTLLLEHQVILSFEQVRLLTTHGKLPESSTKYRAWWANEMDAPGRQCYAWLEAGYRVTSVDLENKTVTLRPNVAVASTPQT
jgi:hypothetical protein